MPLSTKRFLPRPEGGGRIRQWSAKERKEIFRLWDSGKSVNYIRQRFDTHPTTIVRLLEASGRQKENRVARRENHKSWKGGESTNGWGYRMVTPKIDDKIGLAMCHKNGTLRHQVPEHRLVIAHALGRPLRKDETVHHRNGVRTDNRLENLELWQGRHPKGAPLCCAECGSRNLVPIERVPESV